MCELVHRIGHNRHSRFWRRSMRDRPDVAALYTEGHDRSRTRVRMNDAADEPSKPTSAEPEFREISDEELRRILADHKKWVEAEDKTGLDHLRADLSWADLRGADLCGPAMPGLAHLQGAYLIRAQLQEAFLMDAQLQGANLSGAQLQGARPLRGSPTAGGQLAGGQPRRGPTAGGQPLQGPTAGGHPPRGSSPRSGS